MINIDELVNKEMTRKEFVATIMWGIASFVGIASLLGMMSRDSTVNRRQRPGYGENLYGP